MNSFCRFILNNSKVLLAFKNKISNLVGDFLGAFSSLKVSMMLGTEKVDLIKRGKSGVLKVRSNVLQRVGGG